MIVIFLWLLRDGYCIDEAFTRDAVVIDAVEGTLQQGQVFVGDLISAVVVDPVGEVVDVDESRVVSVHVGEEAFTIELQLIALIVGLSVSLDDESEKGGQLL